jgi:hypothetical protein
MNLSGNGYAQLSYYFELSGPGSNPVSVTLNYSVAAISQLVQPPTAPTGHGGTFIQANIDVFGAINQTTATVFSAVFALQTSADFDSNNNPISSPTNGSFSSSIQNLYTGSTINPTPSTIAGDGDANIFFADQQVLDIVPNTIYRIDLTDQSFADLTQAASFVDPYLTIDPAFAGQYSLSFSDGIANDPPITQAPEPNTVLIYLLGTALLGWLSARRSSAG